MHIIFVEFLMHEKIYKDAIFRYFWMTLTFNLHLKFKVNGVRKKFETLSNDFE